jgi:hypothetical protein
MKVALVGVRARDEREGHGPVADELGRGDDLVDAARAPEVEVVPG